MNAKNNRGMAFISVVIAIMFIGLLATSLSYMAYNNYISKTTRWRASEIFYYDEYALDELTSALRQRGTEQSAQRCADYEAAHGSEDDYTPLDPTKVFIEEMAKAAGVTTDNGDYNSSATGEWKAADMTNLVRSYAMTNNSDVEVTVAVSDITGRTTPSYKRNKKDILFSNVQITIWNKKSDYKTVITTDIHIPAEPKSASIPVNEFSLMTDTPFYWNKGGMCSFQGNVFCMDKAAPPHTGVAFSVDNGTNLTVAGKQSLIVGDMEVKGNSIVSLGGETTITGTVHIEAGSTVEFRGSDVRIGGLDNDGMVVGYYEIDSSLADRASSVFDGADDYCTGLASEIQDNVTVIMAGTNASDVKKVTYCKTGTKGAPTEKVNVGGVEKDVPLPAGTYTTDPNHWYIVSDYGSLAAVTDKNSGSMPDEWNRSHTATTHLRPGSDDITGKENSLVILNKAANSIRGDYTNTTIICTANPDDDVTAPYSMPSHSGDESTAPCFTKLNDQAYYDCLNSWAKDVALPNVSAGNMETNFNTGKTELPGTQYETFKDSMPSSYIKMPMDHIGSEERWMMYNTSTNKPCVPWGYFIRDDADDVIGFAFSSIRDDMSGGSDLSVCYENWVKE